VRIKIVAVGKLKEQYYRQICHLYEQRINRYTPIQIREVSKSNFKQIQAIKRGESESILTKASPHSILILCDEKGKTYTSKQFATFLDHLLQQGGNKEIVFALGGPYGFDQKIKTKAAYQLSLSSLTFNHPIARLVLLEQIYRGFTIIRGEPYHN